MDREIVLAVLLLVATGPLTLVAAFAFSGFESGDGPPPSERLLFRDILRPMAPATVVASALAGWALVEPDSAEAVPHVLLGFAVPFAVVWLRAVGRAIAALRPVGNVPAATVGFLRPHIRLSPRYAAALDPSALAAAMAHEAAHARHRDPLRIWIAQLATDLQWPLPGARRRFTRWLAAVERARDDEARRAGVDGADLVVAIVTAVRLEVPGASASASAPASVTGGRVGQALLRERLTRLLAPLPDEPASVRPITPRAVLPAAVLSALLVGLCFGERIVSLLLGRPA